MFKRTTSRVSPATVIASVALFASLGGVGYAAATIGSAEIKNNSVQGKDIKNGTIKSPDIAKGTRNALKGQTGAKGAAGANGTNGTNGTNGANGAPGQKGDTGASGLSKVIARSNPAAFDPPNVLTSVIPGPANALLPAGVHVITVQAQVNPTAANWSMTCDVTLGGDLVDRMTSAGAAALDRTQIVGHAVVQTDAVKALDLLCTDAGTGTILDDLTVSSMEVNEIG